MAEAFQQDLSRRERQIMDILYSHGLSTAAEVRERMPEAPSYSAVRAMLRVLEDKGHIEHAHDGPRYVYSPLVDREEARQSALRHVVSTFFGGSREAVMAALVDDASDDLPAGELERLQKIVELTQSIDSDDRGDGQ